MKRNCLTIFFRVLIIIFWILTTGWLVRYEAFPEYFTHSISGYKNYLSRDILVTDSWMKIILKQTPIGYSYSGIDINETNPIHHYELRNRVYMKLNVMGTTQIIHANAQAFLDILHKLQKFAFTFTAHEHTISVTGTRSRDDLFNVEIRTPNFTDHQTVKIPDDVVIYSPQTEMAVKQLKTGQKLSLRTIDPASLKTTTLIIEALRKEQIEIDGTIHDATVLATDAWGRQNLSWVDAEGNILRQETPFGWIFEKCDATTAFHAFRSSDGSSDVLADMSVPCKGTISAPKTRKFLKLRLTGVPFSYIELKSNRQSIEHLEKTSVILNVSSSKIPPDADIQLTSEQLSPYLESSSFIQADHPDIVTRAKTITEGLKDQASKANAILEWVDVSVVDEMTVSFPSALDVLRTMKGDCNEHTYLFVALARAAGIPAKVIVGLAYYKNSFYYHAWPAVYLGDWVEMDPTWRQKTVDATHIALVEGELENQYQLVKIIGQLNIEVLEAR